MAEEVTLQAEDPTFLHGAVLRSGRAVHTTLTPKVASGLRREGPTIAMAVAQVVPKVLVLVTVARAGAVSLGTGSSSNSRAQATTHSRTTAQATLSTTRTSTLNRSAPPLTDRMASTLASHLAFAIHASLSSLRHLMQTFSRTRPWFSALLPNL